MYEEAPGLRAPFSFMGYQGMVIREQLEAREFDLLSPFAIKSRESRGRVHPDGECPVRTSFQVDRDRIVHSKAFRRLKHKTQVFLSPEGDHYRTRLTHTLEVSQIARTVGRALSLNEDLVEAIALGHDLGHTPFGHAGERVLNQLVPGGFHHVRQSLRVIDHLEKGGAGLNLTFEVRDGIAKHSKGSGAVLPEGEGLLPLTREGMVVRIADIMAYLNHDLDDALRSGLVEPSGFPAHLAEFLTQRTSQRINRMVCDLIASSLGATDGDVRLSPWLETCLQEMRDWLNESVYRAPRIDQEFEKAARLLTELFSFLMRHPELLNELDSDRVAGDVSLEVQVADFIAGMTDRYVFTLYNHYLMPHPWRE